MDFDLPELVDQVATEALEEYNGEWPHREDVIRDSCLRIMENVTGGIDLYRLMNRQKNASDLTKSKRRDNLDGMLRQILRDALLINYILELPEMTVESIVEYGKDFNTVIQLDATLAFMEVARSCSEIMVDYFAQEENDPTIEGEIDNNVANILACLTFVANRIDTSFEELVGYYA